LTSTTAVVAVVGAVAEVLGEMPSLQPTALKEFSLPQAVEEEVLEI